jgi:hypothetical protein
MRAWRSRDERRALRAVVADSPQLHELLHEGQITGHLSDRRAIGGWFGAERHRLTGVWPRVLDDKRVRQAARGERIGTTTQRSFVGDYQRDNDRRWMAGSFASRVGCLGDLRTVREIASDENVDDFGGDCAGRSQRACAFTLDA